MPLRKEIMSDLSKIFSTENQSELLKVIAHFFKKMSNPQILGVSDSETETIFAARTSTPIKTKTFVTNSTPLISRNTLSIVCSKHF